jgi:V/A-type H+-transporting ATPase subunit G/H
MIQERSLLQKIREKELAVSVSVDQAMREADEIVQNARRDAENILKQAETDGILEAKNLYENEMKKVQQEIERLQKLSMAEATNVREQGETRLAAAAEYVVKTVILE